MHLLVLEFLMKIATSLFHAIQSPTLIITYLFCFGEYEETCVTFSIISGFFFPSCNDERNGCYELAEILLLFIQFVVLFFLIFVSLHIITDIVSFKKCQ